jgi:nucleoside phosphorylase
VIRSLRVVCATVGVGMPAAGAGTMRHLRDAKPRAVVLLGSCGVYPQRGSLAPLEIIVPNSVCLIDATALAGKAAFPEPMQTKLASDPALCHALLSSSPTAKTGALATTLSITTDDLLASRVGKKSECIGENLEAFSVALACASIGIPFCAVLAVTNTVGSEARAEWAKYRRKAADHSARLLLDWIHKGARGLPAR